MLCPPRHKRRHCRCATCHVVLGTVRVHHQGGQVLHAAVGLAGAFHTSERGAFRLICVTGHATVWRGSGIKWFIDSEREAA